MSAEIANLSIAFGPVRAVTDVSFVVGAREHVSLLGPSGCGKTTTLRAIAGLETPVAGRIAIAGAPVFDAARRIDVPPERRGLAMVFQSYAIWPHMTVFDNVAFSFRVRGMSRDKARPAVERALALVDLARFADRPATRLSGGQQQRVALARALAFDSRVILFDEPLSNLDAQLRVSMRAELAALRASLGFTAIYVTHDQEEAFALSDRIVVMREGRIEQQGSPAALHATPRTRFVAGFLGMKNIFPASIGATVNGLAEARIADSVVLRARAARPGRSVAFRPIDVELGGEGASGTIVRRLFLGDLAHYVIRSAGLEIEAAGRPRADLAEGSETTWHVPPGQALVLED